MLDQSYSADNFKKILSFENRKGKNLEKQYFPSIFAITLEISELNKKINKRIGYKIPDDPELAKLILEKNVKKELKNQTIEQMLQEVSLKLTDKKFKFAIKKIVTDAKPIYTAESTAENYFAMKQLQYNVKKSFKVKQANRFAIVNQVKSILSDDFPKVIIRTDIKSFYESIPHDKLLSKINDNSLLSFLSKKLIWKILNDFLLLAGADDKIGIPRGIGVSAYLAELYMRDIDREIASLENVIYYSRYVDDIIIVFTPSTKSKIHFNEVKNIAKNAEEAIEDENADSGAKMHLEFPGYTGAFGPVAKPKLSGYMDEVKKIIENGTGLKMNEEKTTEIELINSGGKRQLEFLGYKFEFNNLRFQQIKLTEKKIVKYQTRITKTLTEYIEHRKTNSKAARRLLIHRLNFLTGNTRLENNKENVLIGIYYTNSLLTEKLEDLTALDNYLFNQIDAIIPELALRNRLKLFSFLKGFKGRTYVNFNSPKKRVNLTEILQSW